MQQANNHLYSTVSGTSCTLPEYWNAQISFWSVSNRVAGAALLYLTQQEVLNDSR